MLKASMRRRAKRRPIEGASIVDDLRAARMNAAADLFERCVHETLTYYAFPDIHWQKIRTNNPLERIMRVIPPPDPCGGGVPRWPVMPQPGCNSAALHRRIGLVDQTIHEHAPPLSNPGRTNRSRRLIKCAKESGRYPKPKPGHKIYPYLVRGMARPNQVWAMDITYIPMARGFVYLAIVLDWFSRRVLSWRLSITMEAVPPTPSSPLSAITSDVSSLG